MDIMERLKARGIEPRRTKSGNYWHNGKVYTLRQLVREFLHPEHRERPRIVGVVDIPRKSDIRVCYVTPANMYLAAKYGCSMSAIAKLESYAIAHEGKFAK